MSIALKILQRHGRILPRQAMGAITLDFRSSNNNCSSSSSSSSSSSTNFSFQFVNVKFNSSTAAAAAAAATVPPEEDDKEKNEKSTSTRPTIFKQDIRVNKDKPWLWSMGVPSLLPEWRKMFNASSLLTDVSAGITVGCVAVPLSLAIAVASGVPPEMGLATAAVSGVAGGLLGGTTLAITGPAAAISLLVVGAVQQHGFESLPLITLACGGMQLASGVTRLGAAAKVVPVSVIAGFTTGVGAMILSGQIPKALGLSAPAGLNPIETIGFIGENLSGINPAATALALGVSASMFLLPKVHPKMPSAVLAVGGATLATHTLGLDVALIGSIPSGLESFQLFVPTLPPMEALPSLAATTFLIFAMTSAESLLSCAALEKMRKTSYQHNPDQELVGQGLANMGAAMFTGMPVTSVIARSSLNVKLNAETRLPALVQAGFVFGSVVFFSESIATIPMPALSGMLITTGLAMLSPVEFKHCFAIQKLDAIPFVTTIGGMIAFGLAEGIGIGCVSAWALNYDHGNLDIKEMNLPHKESSNVTAAKDRPPKELVIEDMKLEDRLDMLQSRVSSVETDNVKLKARVVTLQTDNAQLQGQVDTFKAENTQLRGRLDMVESENVELRGLFDTLTENENSSASPTRSTIGWQLKGPINFGAMFKIDDLIHRIEEMRTDEKVIVLDMQETTSVEFTGVEELVNRLVEVAEQNQGTTIQMWNCSEELQNALQQCDPKERIERHCSTISADKAPFEFPEKEEKEVPKEVPFWYDSPHFRPDK